MLRLRLLPLVLLVYVSSAFADPILIQVPNDKVNVLISGGNIDLFTSALNGLTLQGQAVSIDLRWAGDLRMRLSPGSGSIGFGMSIATTAPSFPGFAGPATSGFLLDSNYQPLTGPLSAGRSSCDCGEFDFGIQTFTNGESGIYDIGGVHYDAVFPNTGFTVTNGELRISLRSESQALFGTPAQLPEPASLLLVGAGLAVLLLCRRHVRISYSRRL